MTPLDRSLFLLLNHGLNSDLNDYWLGYATWLGNGWIGFPLALITLVILDRKQFWRNTLSLAVAAIIGGIALNLLKNALHAPRPLTVFGPDLATGKVYINVLFDRLYWNSFPSGHSQTAFTIATVLVWVGHRARKLNLWRTGTIYVIATLIPISRIYCGAHFPSDVIAGSILGWTTAWLSCFAIERITISKSRKRHVQKIVREASNIPDAA